MKLVRFKLDNNYLNASVSYLPLFIRFLTLFCFALCLDSCKQPQKAVNPIVNSYKSVDVPVKKNDPYQGSYQASNNLENDLLNTCLEVSFDWEKQYLNGKATLTFKPYFYSQNILVLDAKGMDIHEVKLLPTSEILKYKYDGKKLNINLGKLYSRKDIFTLSITYTAKPNELTKGGSKAITSDIGLYFINPLGKEADKPRQIWTQGETEASSCWFPTIDSPNEKTTQEMFITVDTNFTVLSNGKFISSKNNLNGTKTDYWKQSLPHAPYLFMMAIGEYAVVKDKWKDIEVNYYVEPDYKKYAKDIFGMTPEMLEFFSNKLGYKYPWAKYSQVIVRDYVSGAMENTSATIFMEAVQSDDRALADDNWETIIAHELFHHWFGDLLTCESWSNLPLNESFANYSEYLWLEYKYGIDAADLHGEKEATEYYEEATDKKAPLIRYHYLDKEDMFDRHSYNKGGRILHMLRKYVGDDAFFESLKLYLQKNEFKPVEVHHLRLAFEEVTGQDLNWFFNQWFLSPGHPELKVDHLYSNGTLHLSVKQTQDTTIAPVYKLPINIDVWINGIKTSHSLLIEKAEQEFEILLLAPPDLVLFDSDFQLLGKIHHEQSLSELIFQYQHYDRSIARSLALKSIFASSEDYGILKNPLEDPLVKEILSASLEDPFWAIRNLAIDQFYLYAVEDFSNYLKKIENIALNDPKSKVRAKAIQLLSAYSNKEYVHVYKKALNEKPYSVAGAGLAAYLKSEDNGVKINFDELEKINNIYMVLPLAGYYVSEGALTKHDWFKQKLAKGSPRLIYNLMGLYVKFALNLNREQQKEAESLLKDISENNKDEQIRYQAQMGLEELIEKTKE